MNAREHPNCTSEKLCDYHEGLYRFTWGKPIRGHEVGPYRIIEYHPRIVEGSTVTHKIDFADICFHLFMENGLGEVKDRSETYHSLDAALAGGISYRAEGCNHRADRYFMAAMDSMRGGEQL